MGWSVHRDAGLAPLAAVWEAASAGQSVFQSFRFARHWAACFAHDTDFRIGWSDQSAAVIPLICRHGHWSFLGEGMFDYQDLIGTITPEEQRAAAQWADAQTQGPACVTGVPADTPAPAFWAALGWRAAQFAGVPLRAAGPDVLAREHARVEHRWQAAGVRLHAVDQPRPRRELVDWLLEHKAQSLAARGVANVLGEPERRWVIRMVEQEPQLAELWELRRGADRLAGLLCWLTPRMRYAYLISYAVSASRLSPGILALYALLRHTMREGRAFNFLTGEQAFKQRFATERKTLQRYWNDDGHI